MNTTYKEIDDYLAEVGRYLDPLADKEQILKELQAHIWDLAHNISEKEKGLTIHESFEQAIMIMEDPKILATKFLEEESNIATEWKNPLTRPESKIQNEQFIILAMAGFIGIMIIAWIIQIATNDPFVAFLSFVMGFIGIAFFIMALYITDEKTFKEQMLKLRVSFQKSYEDIKTEFNKRTTPVPKKSLDFYYVKDESKPSEVSFWPAFGQHLGGFLGGLLTVIAIAFLLYLEISDIPLFNTNWFVISGFAVYFSLSVSLAYNAFLVLFGRIRVTRLASALKNIVGGISGVVVVIYFPFTLFAAITATAPSDILTNPTTYQFIQNADLIMRVIIGLAAVTSFVSALYDVFKFGSWKASDRKSLI
ncbi:hypothetical protein CEE45_14090 [Candidatus Heimdallarchaeota archaeon B3_Heim]|nr:MAG: hypothetical protein CEE45_14090 [Candidatus Heimdallarchaeota archaeon B3_Heim]